MLVKEEVKFEFPGKRLKLPEKLIEAATTPLFRLKLVTLKLGALNDAKVPIETVVPIGVKLKLDNENPCWVRLNVPSEKVWKPLRRFDVMVADRYMEALAGAVEVGS